MARLAKLSVSRWCGYDIIMGMKKKEPDVHSAQRGEPGRKNAARSRRQDLAERVIALVEEARRRVATTANVALVYTYYEVGRMIVENEQGGKRRAAYGKTQLADLSRRLTERLGKGWSVENLKLMRRFFNTYSNWVNGVYQIGETRGSSTDLRKRNSPAIQQTGTAESASLTEVETKSPRIFTLSWSHYLVLMRIDNPDERRFYEIEASENGWDIAELKRQFKSSLYERLALSRDKKGVLELSRRGQVVARPKDDAIVEMTLPETNRQIFASKYLTILPDKEVLRSLVRKQLGSGK